MSAAELMAVLLDGYLRLDVQRPGDLANDHLVFSKGHASPLLYACFKVAGAIDDEELLSFRKLGSRLEGHPAPCCRGSTWRLARSARGCRSGWGWRSRPSGSTGSPPGCGSSAATGSLPRARSGRPSSTPRTKSSTT